MKVANGIVVIEFGIVTSVNSLLSKTLLPRLVTELGIISVDNLLLEKAKSSIEVIVSGIVIVSRLLSLKIFLLRVVSELAISVIGPDGLPDVTGIAFTRTDADAWPTVGVNCTDDTWDWTVMLYANWLLENTGVSAPVLGTSAEREASELAGRHTLIVNALVVVVS